MKRIPGDHNCPLPQLEVCPPDLASFTMKWCCPVCHQRWWAPIAHGRQQSCNTATFLQGWWQREGTTSWRWRRARRRELNANRRKEDQ